MLMSPADEAWVKELYEANALKLGRVKIFSHFSLQALA